MEIQTWQTELYHSIHDILEDLCDFFALLRSYLNVQSLTFVCLSRDRSKLI